jgi:hypothetical protein
MATLRPSLSASEVLLRRSGVIESEKKNGKSRISHILDDRGLDLERAAEVLQELSYSGDEQIRFRTIETALKLHDAFPKDSNTNQVPNITFVIRGDNTDIKGILTPREVNFDEF